ncbi:MAG TPA: polymorphic toxin-type HINT domain-containing protein, partial [Candidatus Babeliaceae bacterium]|nr:polymorphic toxin-type HINT domain-containing protein [Candidatus Babeliaceae bacterium]
MIYWILFFLYGSLYCDGFTGLTPIKCSDGYKAIQELKQDDLVFGFNFTTNERSLEKIKRTACFKVNSIVRLGFGNQTLEMALDQRLFVPTIKRWVTAQQLVSDPDLVRQLQETYPLKTIDLIVQDTEVYALTVENIHNFYVTTQ